MLVAQSKDQIGSLLTNNLWCHIICQEILGFYISFTPAPAPPPSSPLSTPPTYQDPVKLQFTAIRKTGPPDNAITFDKCWKGNGTPIAGSVDFDYTFQEQPNFILGDLPYFSNLHNGSYRGFENMYISYDQLEFVHDHAEFIVFSSAHFDIDGKNNRMDQVNYGTNVFFTLKIEGCEQIKIDSSVPFEPPVPIIIDNPDTNIPLTGRTDIDRSALRTRKFKLRLVRKLRSKLKREAGFLANFFNLFSSKERINIMGSTSFIPMPLLMAPPTDPMVPITTAAIPCPPNWDEL